jgi:hypothetical protein
VANVAQAATGAYTALTPTRLLDTRSAHTTLGPLAKLNLPVVGTYVPGTATAVALNVTVTSTTANSFLAVYPTGQATPTVSNLNWMPGETIPNLVIVPIGTGGDVTFYNAFGDVDVIADLEGYFSPETTGDTVGSYVPLTPARIADTRTNSSEPYAGHTLQAGSTLNIQVTGAGGVPSTGVAGALLNVTVTDTTQQSFLTVFPQGVTMPLASNLNWLAGGTIPNRVVVPVSSSGQITVYNPFGQVDVIVDVDGYFTAGNGTAPAGASLFGTVGPVRVLDTRLSSQTLGSSGVVTQQIAGVDGIASNASAVISNMPATDTSWQSFYTVYPGGTRPTSSDLNWFAGTTIPNLTVATLSGTGSVSVFNAFGTADLIIDVSGYFAPETPSAPVILTTSLPPATVGHIGYSATLSGYGGTPAYTWTIFSGSLPPGLTLSTAGVISGQATAAAGSPYHFTVELTDSTTPTANTATQALSITAASVTTRGASSNNWSGYAVTGGPFTSVTGTFQLPALNPSDAPDSAMSEWVGINGTNDPNVLQAGITEWPDGLGSYWYFPWWEIAPADAVDIYPGALTDLAPGDFLTVTISQVDGTDWAVNFVDTTQSESFTADLRYTGAATSAEWIVEAPDFGGGEVPLADAGTMEFSLLGASGAETAIDDISMWQSSVRVSTPSTLDSTGFNVEYGASAPPPP